MNQATHKSLVSPICLAYECEPKTTLQLQKVKYGTPLLKVLTI